VEIVGEAVESARENCELNGISGVSFVHSDARPFLAENSGKFDTLILDPPRSGMHPKMLKYIRALGPERIIYMSCNPVVFRDELPGLEGYTVQWIEAYDMFPQTPHVETLALLVRNS
jgi:23S rRNA (uracil1939-C5)-methyltransferase